MKRILQPLIPLVAALLYSDTSLSAARAQNTRYFDVNDDAPQSGVWDAMPYSWDAIERYWNANSDGSGAGPGTTAAWVNGDHAVFSAGSDGAGLRYGVNIGSGVTAGSAAIEDGTLVINIGTLNTGSGTVAINAGATLEVRNVLALDTTPGKVMLNGGTLLNTNFGQASSFIRSVKGIEINGTGTIGYDDGDNIPDNKISVYMGVISGTGGTPTNGGAGTLIKIGPDQIGIQGSNQGGVNSQSQFSFAKLIVKEGGYRGRVNTISGQLDETFLGAVPLGVMTDAVTLDGGGIGVNKNTTLHPNRGITIGPNGGYFDHGISASLNIPGPLSGSGTLTIGNPTSTGVANVTFTLSNPNSVNTFTGGLVGIRGILQLNSSLRVASLNDGPTNNATISVAAGQTLTVGIPVRDDTTSRIDIGQATTFDTASASDTWSTAISGPGGLNKAGTGTQALTGTPTYTGDTRIQGGILSIANAYLANGADVYLSTGSTLDLSFAGTDTIRSLYFDNVLQPAGTWGAPGSGAQFSSNLLSGSGLLGPTIGVPEPASLGLALFGLLTCFAAGRQR